MMLLMLAMMAAEPWEAFTVDPTNPEQRQTVLEIQKDPSSRTLIFKFSGGPTSSWGMNVKDFFKIEREGTVWIEKRSSSGEDKGLRTMYLEKVNCQDRTTGLVAGISYNADGSIKSRGETKMYSVEMSYAVPGSIGEDVVAAACKNFD